MVQVQELIRGLSLWKNPMEGLVRGTPLKFYSARIKNAQVSNLGQNRSLMYYNLYQTIIFFRTLELWVLKYLILLVTPSELSYAFEKKGEKSCTSGSIIISKSECRIACAQLQLKMVAGRDGKSCYKAGNGKCRQDGRDGRKASLICKNEGNKVCYHLTVINHIQIFQCVCEYANIYYQIFWAMRNRC